MKITIIYGENSRDSRKRFSYIIETIKKRGWEIVNVTKDSSLNLAENLSSSQLFAGEKLFVVDGQENMDVANLDWIKKHGDKNDSKLLIFVDGSLSKKLSSNLPKIATKEKFDLPVLIFKFLDMFYPKNSTKVITTLHEILENESIELVFALLSRHLRDLYWIKADMGSLPYPPWRKDKLKRQASLFNDSLLQSIINKLAAIDIEIKTSEASLPLLLDLVIVKELQ